MEIIDGPYLLSYRSPDIFIQLDYNVELSLIENTYRYLLFYDKHHIRVIYTRNSILVSDFTYHNKNKTKWINHACNEERPYSILSISRLVISKLSRTTTLAHELSITEFTVRRLKLTMHDFGSLTGVVCVIKVKQSAVILSSTYS
jgi:hypothetical protein